MYKIRYYYSSVAKQAFICIIALYLLVRLVLFHVAGFSEFYYPLLSTMLYLAGFGLCFFFFTAYKYFYVDFDDKTATAYNKLLRRQTTIALSDVQKAVFSRTGIQLYTQDMGKPAFYVPIYFFGKLSPVGAENFEIMLRNLKVPEVTKTYKVLPGYGRFATFISYFFFCSCIPFLFTTAEFAVVTYMVITQGMPS